MLNTFKTVTLLVEKFRRADASTQTFLRWFVRNVRTSGAIPLGLKDGIYWWLVYDASCFPSEDALIKELYIRSPYGYCIDFIRI